jgi:hypothetical protein
MVLGIGDGDGVPVTSTIPGVNVSSAVLDLLLD